MLSLFSKLKNEEISPLQILDLQFNSEEKMNICSILKHLLLKKKIIVIVNTCDDTFTMTINNGEIPISSQFEIITEIDDDNIKWNIFKKVIKNSKKMRIIHNDKILLTNLSIHSSVKNILKVLDFMS